MHVAIKIIKADAYREYKDLVEREIMVGGHGGWGRGLGCRGIGNDVVRTCLDVVLQCRVGADLSNSVSSLTKEQDGGWAHSRGAW
jgi:hypothetical protein